MIITEVAKILNGTIQGDESLEILAMASLLEAREGDVSFLSNSKYAKQMTATAASVVLVTEDFTGETSAKALIRVSNPDKAFASLAPIFGPKPVIRAPGIHPSAVIAPSATIGKNVHIGACTVIEAGATIGDDAIIEAQVFIGQDVKVGNRCHIYPQVTIREGCLIGDETILHTGVRIGSDGYGYTVELTEQGPTVVKVPQVGIVEIGRGVEIGSNTCIDRARFGRTRIGNMVKIDNLVQIGHNVQIADLCGVIAQAGIAGSAKIESGVIIWSQAGVSGHLTVHERAQVGPKSGVTSDVPEGEYVIGLPAVSKRKFAESLMMPRQIDKLKKKLADLEAQVKALEKDL